MRRGVASRHCAPITTCPRAYATLRVAYNDAPTRESIRRNRYHDCRSRSTFDEIGARLQLIRDIYKLRHSFNGNWYIRTSHTRMTTMDAAHDSVRPLMHTCGERKNEWPDNRRNGEGMNAERRWSTYRDAGEILAVSPTRCLAFLSFAFTLRFSANRLSAVESRIHCKTSRYGRLRVSNIRDVTVTCCIHSRNTDTHQIKEHMVGWRAIAAACVFRCDGAHCKAFREKCIFLPRRNDRNFHVNVDKELVIAGNGFVQNHSFFLRLHFARHLTLHTCTFTHVKKLQDLTYICCNIHVIWLK